MAFRFQALPRSAPSSHFLRFNGQKFLLLPQDLEAKISRSRGRGGGAWALQIRASNGGESYLSMWKNAVERERKSIAFQRVVEKSAGNNDRDDGDKIADMLEKRSEEFNKILEVPKEERDRIQRMQVVDRAAAAIAAARALIGEAALPAESNSGHSASSANLNYGNDSLLEALSDFGSEKKPVSPYGTSQIGTPGPDFWSWTPPQDNYKNSNASNEFPTPRKLPAYPVLSNLVKEKEPSIAFLSIPFQSELSESNLKPLLPPLQSTMAAEKLEAVKSSKETHSLEEDEKVGIQFSVYAAEAARALHNDGKELGEGINPDGSRWWKETGVEQRPDGVLCKWTLIRGVSADQVTEWQNKFWEAADEFGYKELGSEKSGRDASGNVWREYWRESMLQEQGFVQHLEKTADKWAKNGNGSEWQEKWCEYYNASGEAEKNAHKWCRIDPSTYVDDGHAHIWHERWGEKYDGKGGSMKYTDKWAERFEGDGWTKWGDKWDENFDPNSHGVKQGETWWEGKDGELWNRTWGERHNGSGWVHKYGKSSSGEHWDTHIEQETWYERFPHYGLYHCFENSVQLREVQKPSETL